MNLDTVRQLAGADRGLAVVATLRSSGAVQATVVNAGVMKHPVTERDVVAFVARGRARKLDYLRQRPSATVTFRAGWEWVSVEGQAEIAGPDDALPGVEAADLPPLLRDVFRAAGGDHNDWAEYDRVMATERRAAVLITPSRIYSNPQG